MPKIPPIDGRLESLPSGLRALLSQLQLITVIELPSLWGGRKLEYFRYQDSLLAPLVSDDGGWKEVKLAHREVGSVSYANCYAVNPAGMGQTKICSFVFSYRIISDIPAARGEVGVGEGRGQAIRNLDTGEWEVSEFRLSEPEADDLASALASKVKRDAISTVLPPMPHRTPSSVDSRRVLVGHWNGTSECIDFVSHTDADSLTALIYYCESPGDPARITIGPLGSGTELRTADGGLSLKVLSSDSISVTPNRLLLTRSGQPVLHWQDAPRPAYGFYRVKNWR